MPGCPRYTIGLATTANYGFGGLVNNLADFALCPLGVSRRRIETGSPEYAGALLTELVRTTDYRTALEHLIGRGIFPLVTAPNWLADREANESGHDNVWAVVLYMPPHDEVRYFRAPFVFYGRRHQAAATVRVNENRHTHPGDGPTPGLVAAGDYDVLPTLFINQSSIAALSI